MTTFGDLIDDVENVVYNLGTQRDKVTALTAAVTSTSALSLSVVDAKQVDRGFVEVDRELIAVVSTDHTANTIAVQPWGRGAKGTTAATHAIGARVTNSPRYPRFRMGVEIQQVVDSLYPDLWQVATDETQTVRPPQVAYPVPAAVDSIVSVSVQLIGPSKVWQPVTRWRLDKNADATAFTTGKSLDIYSAMPPGRKIKILYRKKFGTFSTEATTVDSVGLEERYRDIIKFRAAAKLIMAADVARVQIDSVEAANRAEGVQPMSATRVATQMMTFAQTRMHEERLRLLREWPSSAVRSN